MGECLDELIRLSGEQEISLWIPGKQGIRMTKKKFFFGRFSLIFI